MNTESCPSSDLDETEEFLSQEAPAPSIFQALQAVAHSMRCRINLTDHLGRRFLKDFHVDNAPAIGRCAVWGISASGASQLVAWPPGKGRGPSGNRVQSGWGNPKSAQKVADQLNEAAATWCAQYGPVPKQKPRTRNRRK
jgi:hypothetical protein